MNIAKFENLDALTEEYNMCWNEAKKADQEAKEILAAVKARIENEKKTASDRITSLKNQITDSGKSETVRRVAALELSGLEGKKYTITEEERAEVRQAIDRGRAALSDARKVSITEALKEAEAEIKAARAETIGCTSKDFVLCGRWLDERDNELSRL
jgi:hypothetical protein